MIPCFRHPLILGKKAIVPHQIPEDLSGKRTKAMLKTVKMTTTKILAKPEGKHLGMGYSQVTSILKSYLRVKQELDIYQTRLLKNSWE